MQRLSGRLSDGVKAPVKALQAARFRHADEARCSRGFRRRSEGALQAHWCTLQARWCAFQARYWCALQARWWLAGGALVARASGAPSSAVSGKGRRWAPLGAIAGVVRRHLHASLGRVKGATAALLGRFISAIGGALERGRYRRH